jgi:sulfoxide reductase heme-binding subunit YedZ
MVGVTSLVYTIAHIIIYFALRFWNFAAITYEMATRVSLILATLSTIGLLALGATSFDMAIRRMGARRWQNLHSIIYATAALGLIHYLLSPDMYPEQYLMSGMFFWLMAWRALNRRGLGADPIALVALAFASSLFTAIFEAGWTWIYHGYEPSWTLSNNFSLDLGVSAAWKILVPGLLVALAAAARWTPRLRTA